MKKILTRRGFLKYSGSLAGGLSLGIFSMYAEDGKRKPKVRFGVCTDSHYADAPDRNGRDYRSAKDEMTEFSSFMNNADVDFVIELGDFKDQDDPPVEEKTLGYLREIEAEFKKFDGPRYHVMGNHDLDSISKAQFLEMAENTGISKKSKYYSFDVKGIHFIVLDSNFDENGADLDHGNFSWKVANVSPVEMEWLAADLESTSRPVVVFIHQELHGMKHTMVNNAAEVRKILQESGKVLTVFQGHNHEGQVSSVEGIHYYTLKPMIGGKGKNKNSYATVEVFGDKSIQVTGYGKAVSKIISGK